MSSVRSLGAALLLASLIAALTAALLATPAGAVTVSVEVRDDRFVPAEVEIVVGDEVRWLWVGEGDHSVWFPGIDHSHPGCTTASPSSCSNPGDDPYERRFDQSGEFGYLCRFHGASMSGTVIVADADPPTPPVPTDPTDPTEEPSRKPTPKPTPTPEPSEDPTEDPSEDPTDEPTEDPSSEPPSETPFVHEPPPPPPPPPPPRQLPNDPVPDDTATSSEASPSEIEFEPFPAPGEGSDDPADDEVAVDFPGGGDPDRPVLLAVATLAVVGSATTFGALVLFGPPWMG
jgi:plastocyanin